MLPIFLLQASRNNALKSGCLFWKEKANLNLFSLFYIQMSIKWKKKALETYSLLTNDLWGNNAFAFPAVLHFGTIQGLIENMLWPWFCSLGMGGYNWHEASEELPFNECHLANLGLPVGNNVWSPVEQNTFYLHAVHKKLVYYLKNNFLFSHTYLLNSKCCQVDNSIVSNSLMFHHN